MLQYTYAGLSYEPDSNSRDNPCKYVANSGGDIEAFIPSFLHHTFSPIPWDQVCQHLYGDNSYALDLCDHMYCYEH